MLRRNQQSVVTWLYCRPMTRLRIDLNLGTLDVLLEDSELQKRRNRLQIKEIEHQTPWQEIYRDTVGQLSSGGIIELAAKYRKIRHTIPRHSH